MQTLIITPDIQHRQFHVKLPDEFDLDKYVVQIVFKKKETKQETNYDKIDIDKDSIDNFKKMSMI